MSIKRLLDYIEQNIKEEITLVDLAEIVHYSPRQIYYMIKEATGMPVMSYIRHKRLQKAAEEIAKGRKLFDVAVEYGFETQAGFYKAFLLQIGCSPKEHQYHEQLHYAQKNYPSIELMSKEENMMDDIKIRKVEQKDTHSIWENIFSRNTPEEIEQRIAESIAEMEAGRRIHLVAVIEDNVIGSITLLKESHILYSHRCSLVDMVVNPAFQKQGLGRRLFEEACKEASELGFCYVTTTCRGDGTEQFYKALGMEECGKIPQGIYEPWGELKKYDEIILMKGLKKSGKTNTIVKAIEKK